MSYLVYIPWSMTTSKSMTSGLATWRRLRNRIFISVKLYASLILGGIWTPAEKLIHFISFN